MENPRPSPQLLLSLSNIALFWGVTGRGTKVSCRIDRCAATNRVTQRDLLHIVQELAEELVELDEEGP